MDRRLNITVYLVVVFLFCQAHVHTTTQSKCERTFETINIQNIVPGIKLPARTFCMARIPICAGLCHSVDRYMQDDQLVTKCGCCQPVKYQLKTSLIMMCGTRYSNNKYRQWNKKLDLTKSPFNKVKVLDITACGCMTCKSKTSWRMSSSSRSTITVILGEVYDREFKDGCQTIWKICCCSELQLTIPLCHPWLMSLRQNLQ